MGESEHIQSVIQLDKHLEKKIYWSENETENNVAEMCKSLPASLAHLWIKINHTRVKPSSAANEFSTFFKTCRHHLNFYVQVRAEPKSFQTLFRKMKTRSSYPCRWNKGQSLSVYHEPLTSLLHRCGKIWKGHSCINNPLKSLEGFEILTKELAGTSFCSSSKGSRGSMCVGPIINHTIQQHHCTYRKGLSPVQPDSELPSLQMSFGEDLYMCMWRNSLCVCVCHCVLSIRIKRGKLI